MKKDNSANFGENIMGIQIVISVISLLLFCRCSNERNPQNVSYQYIEELNNGNIEYFKNISPEHYRDIPEYQVLMKINAIVFDARSGGKIIMILGNLTTWPMLKRSTLFDTGYYERIACSI